MIDPACQGTTHRQITSSKLTDLLYPAETQYILWSFIILYQILVYTISWGDMPELKLLFSIKAFSIQLSAGLWKMYI